MTGDRAARAVTSSPGPVFVEGAEPGDALEVNVLSIDLPIDYGYNGCSGFVRENCDAGAGRQIIPLDREDDDGRLPAGHRDPAEAVLRQHGRGAAAGARAREQQPARPVTPAISTTRSWSPARTLFIPVLRAGRALRDRRRPRRAGRRRSRSDGDRNLAARTRAADRAQGHDADLAARGNAHDYISMGTDADLTKATRDRDPGDGRLPRARRRSSTKHQAYQLVSIAGNVAITQLVDRPTWACT